MKTLIVVRHAKSSWAEPGLSDFDRPLNERGKKDGPNIAKRLKKRNIAIDLFVSSPAKRAKRTADLFADAVLEVVDRFGALSYYDNLIKGHWTDQGHS